MNGNLGRKKTTLTHSFTSMETKLKAYQNWESVGTVIWLVSDFLWMCSYSVLAGALSCAASTLLLGACILYKFKEKKSDQKESELNALNATACWCFMNLSWITSDISEHKDIYMLSAKGFFILATIFVYCAVRAAKKEGQPTDFKRLKLK